MGAGALWTVLGQPSACHLPHLGLLCKGTAPGTRDKGLVALVLGWATHVLRGGDPLLSLDTWPQTTSAAPTGHAGTWAPLCPVGGTHLLREEGLFRVPLCGQGPEWAFDSGLGVGAAEGRGLFPWLPCPVFHPFPILPPSAPAPDQGDHLQDICGSKLERLEVSV